MIKKGTSGLGLVCTGLTVIMALAWLFPVYWIVATAFKSETDTIALPPSFVPFPPDLGAFIYVIQNSPIFRWYLNTILVSGVITFFSIFCALMCAYALALLDFIARFNSNEMLLVAVLASIVAFYASARGLQDGEPVPVIAVTGTAANIAGIAGGIVVFGDPMAGSALGVTLPVRAIFMGPTVAEIAVHTEEALASDIAAMTPEEVEAALGHLDGIEAKHGEVSTAAIGSVG